MGSGYKSDASSLLPADECFARSSCQIGLPNDWTSTTLDERCRATNLMQNIHRLYVELQLHTLQAILGWNQEWPSPGSFKEIKEDICGGMAGVVKGDCHRSWSADNETSMPIWGPRVLS